MSPIAYQLLSKAYEHYLQTSNPVYSHHSPNGDDRYFSTEAAIELYEDGYIKNLSPWVLEDEMNPGLGPIVFELTLHGVEYVRTNREL